ncbi:MAG: hypothetical protein DWQ18_04330 [Crenarchaeota archaeon]|nr:MAG: hypothetical protein DWQ17_08800 [Thermoproteota archaeon]RDJ34134.1 MAG: hypothetical protein DWQ18_04330 [Thermoproteota archaeon]RDJ36750.1 MAG: hypothetical protein DWQ13_06280 [Thermoproteota archaeon]RDJ37716.1 MAG: hypothetical protein DWQ19_04555 [Thermoproteota archaeon]
MKDNSTIIKENFYEWVKNFGEEKIVNELQKNSQNVISQVVDELNSKFIELKINDDEKMSVLITVMMHYFLTTLLLPSQRKIIHEGIEIDIIIPNLKKLKNETNHTLIIDIPTNQTPSNLEKRLHDLQRIQPINENIWFLLYKKKNLNCKVFSIEDNTLFNIIKEIKKFTETHSSNQLKILKN